MARPAMPRNLEDKFKITSPGPSASATSASPRGFPRAKGRRLRVCSPGFGQVRDFSRPTA